MRSYGKYAKNYEGVKKERKSRISNEWDIRLDVTERDTEHITNTIRGSLACIDYVLVSGIERPDTNKSGTGSHNDHIHIALVSKYGLRRDQALALCRGLTPIAEEYCTPRNTRFTYAGWYLHHTKPDYKLLGQPEILYEYGYIPADHVNHDNCKEIQRMFKKFGFGNEYKMIKFSKYMKKNEDEDPKLVQAALNIHALIDPKSKILNIDS